MVDMRIIFLAFALIGMMACKQPAPLDAEGKLITVAESHKMGKANIYDLVDSITYLLLETSDRILLGDVIRAMREEDRYFVQDTKGLFAFDVQGKFVCEIGRRGQGFGEYYNLDCFYLDKERKQVCIVSNVLSLASSYAILFWGGHMAPPLDDMARLFLCLASCTVPARCPSA